MIKLDHDLKLWSFFGGKMMDDITITVRRDAVCMGDDVFEHKFSITYKRYDAINMMTLLKIIDMWLVKIDYAVWTVSLGSEVLGTIEIVAGEHKINVCKDEPLRKLDFSKDVICTHKYIR